MSQPFNTEKKNRINGNSFTSSFIDDSHTDFTLFETSCSDIIGRGQGLHGIGTLGEKTVHAVLKNYYGPQSKWQEIKIGPFVADICREGEIYEIQSKSFYLMKKKLEYFLQDYEVTIVYPVVCEKYLRYVNPKTGEIAPPRKSIKKGHIYQIVPELYSIREFLNYPNLHFILSFITMEEYKLLDGFGKDKKKGGTKTDRIPTAILGEYHLYSIAELIRFLPENLPEIFTSKELSALAKCSLREAQILLNLLQYFQQIKHVGNKNRYHQYQKI
ncbi:MAG: hypothetical protein ACI4DU_02865 [Lachnospiraceae bacterium]